MKSSELLPISALLLSSSITNETIAQGCYYKDFNTKLSLVQQVEALCPSLCFQERVCDTEKLVYDLELATHIL